MSKSGQDGLPVSPRIAQIEPAPFEIARVAGGKGGSGAAIHIQGVWIVEIAELDAIGRAEVSRIKAFPTRTTDRFRPPYGRYTVEVPRQCVFAGTVNPESTRDPMPP